ncbi:MAG: histidine phosphatase family protein [Patescibacteria group bacterium]
MPKIYLARHGQNRNNANGILNGRTDEPLTELGIEQANQIATKIKKAGLTINKVYSSPLSRALQTGQIISDHLVLPEPTPIPELIEREMGAMNGQRVCDIEKMCAPDVLQAGALTYFLHADGAETFPEIRERATKLLDYLKTADKGNSILLVTHDGIGKMLYSAYYDLNWMETLKQLSFHNSDILILSEDSTPENTHIFKTEQHNA